MPPRTPSAVVHRPPQQIQICPHAKAPLFDSKSAPLLFKQLAQEASSSTFHPTPELMDLLRQAGLVSLWFFGKYIAGYSGPFDLLNEDLHVEMCNFRQSLLRPGSRGAMFLPRGHYKDLSISTPILTANRGWTTHGEVVVGDSVFAPNGKPVRVLGVSERFHDNKGFKFTFSDGSTITCGETHLWRVVQHKRKRPCLGKLPGKYRYRIGNLSYREEKIVSATELIVGDDVGVLEGPLYRPERPLPVHPYLLGVWLGDGSSAVPVITLSLTDREIIDRIRALGYVGKETQLRHREHIVRFSVHGVVGKLRELGVLGDKHIPEVYKFASTEQRWDLLRGLMDTDGHAGGGKNKNTATFCNTNPQLVEDIYDLACSLALRPRKREYWTTYKGNPYRYYQVSFQHFSDRNPFCLRRKANLAKAPSLQRKHRGVRKIESVVLTESSCLQVEGNLYLASRELVPTHNSTLVTELASAWEALRWPAIRIRISNAIADKAQDFLKSVKAIFDSNDLVAALYPEFVPRHNQEAWNDTVLTLNQSVRGKKYREGTVEYGGCGGASEGHHYDLHIVDDMIGLAALNSTRGSNAVMMSTENWFWASEKPLLVSMRNSRVIVVGTRYAVDDVYDSIIKKAYVQTGYPMRNFTPSTGSWQVYYRKGIEDGEIIFPEEFTREAYDELAKDDYWAFVTQYLNDPQEAGLAELVNYECGKAFMDVEHEGTSPEWSLEVGMDTYRLSDCDVIMAVDPAGTERFVSAKTSRSAVIVLATTPRDQKVVISLQVGYVPSTTMFDWIFAAAVKFKDTLRTTYLESNSGFKVLAPLLFEEERRRGIALHLRPFPAVGDKDVRIRNTLQPELNAKRIYALEAFKAAVDEEIMSFPQSRRKDIVDCLATAVANRILPPTAEERERREKSKRKFAHRTSNVCGY